MNILPKSILSKPIGGLIGGKAAIYRESNGNLDIATIAAIKLLFDSGQRLKIECDKDGESIAISSVGEIEETRMGEWGDFTVESIDKIPLLCSKIGRSVLDAAAIEDVFRRNVGIVFRFSSQENIYILNLGDNIAVCENLPFDYNVAHD